MGMKFISAVALVLSLGLVAAPDGDAGESKAPPAKGKSVKRAKSAKPAAPHTNPTRPATSSALDLRSNVALVIDNSTGEAVVSKNVRDVQPIASITKLMTALVVLDTNPSMDQGIAITEEDVDSERGSRSRLKVGSELARGDLLHLALMASENRAAHALGRSHSGGLATFVAAMNDKARALGMERTRFVDPTGLSSGNVSTAEDLVKLVKAAHNVPLIRRY
jgi:D-alanyl-D-alanine endopeptidase (penicillin-binding protein 7)